MHLCTSTVALLHPSSSLYMTFPFWTHLDYSKSSCGTDTRLTAVLEQLVPSSVRDKRTQRVIGPRPASARLNPVRNEYFIQLFNDFRETDCIGTVYCTVSRRSKKFRAAEKFRARPKSFAGRAEKFRAAGKSVARRAPTEVSPALKVSRELINQHF